ncbi:MAG: response regulator [Bacteroidetes bacterium]|nr:response regulator [Bacteroidota bacterium]MCL5737491.1 response regulator [Bacteroidota bacterium]
MRNILVVDDNAINRQLAVYLLKKGGYNVYEAESGRQAFDFLAEQTPDVILLDIQLPEMDGVEVLKRIRANAATKNITVIALTAYTMRGDREKFEAAGFDGYLPKPIEPRTFANQILEIHNS